ncbi:hypothetical protein HPB51_008895 [Rhipicephalus microplus]|uniref:Uncharacterized protein n=1 Tax=Rhipicephalus microplus TaxID=6941 RepID=A0A9J6EP82_RHIMP|nr:hypothetical protein HPB51_008895 [Rhipicephalus microplus]
MAVGGWFSGGAQSSLLHAYLETSGGASTKTTLSDHTDGNRKYCHLDTWHRLCRSKETRTAGTVRALTGSLSAMCVSVVTRTHSYLKHSTILRAVSVKATPVEDQHKQRRPSFIWQRCQHPTKQQPQKRSDCGADATKESVCVDNGVERRPWTTWMPALCAGVVAVLCYVNSLDGDFVHDDMVAVVGNPDVTGENRRHAASSSLSSLWMNDFWGRPMADPRSHKSYRPLTVLTFR